MGPHLGYVVRITPIFFRHEVRPFVRGTLPQLEDLQSPCLLTTYPKWDDPPSMFSRFLEGI